MENFVIHTMTEVNLSESNMVHEAAAPYRAQWEYLLATEQLHEIDKVMEDMGGIRPFRLIPIIAAQPECTAMRLS